MATTSRRHFLGAMTVPVTGALAGAWLRPGGALLVKVFQGGELPALRGELATRCGRVFVEKPRASRGESVEVFLLGQSWRGNAGE